MAGITGQGSLFPVERPGPHGFSYEAGFLSEAEEEGLLETIAHIAVRPLVFQGFEAKRKVKSFGYDYHFDSRTITQGRPISQAFAPLLEKVSAHLQLPVEDLKELLVTEYPPGSVINWHRDAPPFDVVIGVSLLSDCQFRFRPYAKSEQRRSNIIAVPVMRRSLYVIRGEARSEREHSIAPVQEKRYSLTLRTLKAI
ncbi:Alkylated DNA repair dioxygenase AlkB [Parapedobacter composti]|uniref:Alkylated DNA repair dioxygenase AlkB n=1 Tax=Parapedobacter composti TaxID=623281 RepID=A0A1I1IT31_9SPHI|nr:alpha-ketoglutarate-dependent dioxygenase AlkB [Parapedobacter composti]SFC39365.1 Alkylated DNA repair dioxygenase AlkB [Parapedobacter composti]